MPDLPTSVLHRPLLRRLPLPQRHRPAPRAGTRPLAAGARLLAAGACLLAAGLAVANDFPTADRVLYVQECMREHPGNNFEMVQKCSCMIDRIAGQVPHEQYVELATIAKAMSIGGERGNELRDNDSLKPALRRYRELQTQAKKSCFILP